ncbi:unnamed protein product, partial [Ectocarpus sp. 8 AP-2014]
RTIDRLVLVNHQHSPPHFYTVEADANSKVLKVCDSSEGCAELRGVRARVERFLQCVNHTSSKITKTDKIDCPRQKDSVSCAIYACIYATFLVQGKVLPT